MEWFNEPQSWNQSGSSITVTTDAKTDFWRKTHNGAIRDNGHFYYQNATGNFIADIKIQGQYRDLYDQAGLMLRLDGSTWLKCGIEFVDGVQHASVVVTRGYSDWSVVPLPQNPDSCWLRVVRNEGTIEVSYSLDGTHYQMLRQTHLTPAETLQVGPMCASPIGSGFPVVFEGFAIRNQ